MFRPLLAAGAAASALSLAACTRDAIVAPDATPAVAAVATRDLAPRSAALYVAPTRPSATAIAPTLPSASVTTTYTTPTGRTIRPATAQALQAAIDTARSGDQILLTPGATYVGNFALPAKSSGSWITIRTDGTLPAAGVRMTPARAAGTLARLVTPNVSPALRTLAGAHHYRVMAVEITADAALSSVSVLVNLGDGGALQSALAQVPSYLILDRVYVHGTATLDLKRCVGLNSAHTAIIDSYVSDCHSNVVESQAIAGWNGPGPFKIVNNYIEGAGVNLMFGGALPAITGLIPSDITIQRNHMTKPAGWRERWFAKTIFELKFARRVLVEGNVIENAWVDGQTGFAVLLKTSANDVMAWAETRDVTMRYNVVRNAAAGVAIAGGAPIAANRIRIEHNLFTNIGTFNGTTNGRMLQLVGPLADVTVTHNTFVPNTADGITLVLGEGVASNMWVGNNVLVAGSWEMTGAGGQGSVGLDRVWTSYSFAGNALVGFVDGRFPAGNVFPTTVASLGFVDAAAGDYRLASTSPWRGKATDRTDPGANIASVQAKTANVVLP